MITALILDRLRICGLPNDQPQDHARRGWCPECRWNYGRGQWHQRQGHQTTGDELYS